MNVDKISKLKDCQGFFGKLNPNCNSDIFNSITNDKKTESKKNLRKAIEKSKNMSGEQLSVNNDNKLDDLNNDDDDDEEEDDNVLSNLENEDTGKFCQKNWLGQMNDKTACENLKKNILKTNEEELESKRKANAYRLNNIGGKRKKTKRRRRITNGSRSTKRYRKSVRKRK
jgi:hypothetical protein